MGLIIEDVEINLCPSNIKHFRSLGYMVDDKIKKGKWGVINVKTNELPTYSSVKVKVQCEDCLKVRKITYSTYSRTNRNGKTYCHDCISKRMSGENSPHWNHKISNEERENYRGVDGYVDFIKTVLNRDNYTCQCCGKHGSTKLNVHHLDGYNWYIAGRIDPQNAITLCENCHENFHSLYGKGNNTKEQFEEWIGKSLTLFKNGDIDKLPRTKMIYCFETQKIYTSATEAEKELNVSHTTIYNICNGKILYKNGKGYCCRSAKGYHFIYYEEYLKLIENNDNNSIYKTIKDNRTRQVICLTTMKIFKTIKEAQEYYNISGDIGNCCKGKRKTCGQLLDGTKLKWMYYDDYIKNCDDNLINNKAS